MLIDDGTGGLSERAIGVAIEIHKQFGPGLLEAAYHRPLVWALDKRGFQVESNKPLSVEFEGKVVPRAYIIDIAVDGKLIIEVKSVAAILPIHIAQVKTYLRLSGMPAGLIINFNVAVLRHGIRRVLHPALPRTPSSRK